MSATRRLHHVEAGRLVRTVVALALATRTATADDVPGTDDDPVRALEAMPMLTDARLVPGLSMRGAAIEDTRVLLDGFELPWIFHAYGRRSLIASGAFESIAIHPGHVGVEQGQAAHVVAIDTWRMKRSRTELTSIDVSTGSLLDAVRVTARISSFDLRPTRDRGGLPGTQGRSYTDLILRYDRPLTDRWRLAISGLVAADGRVGPGTTVEQTTALVRPVVQLQYARDAWTARVGLSPMLAGRSAVENAVQHADERRVSLDARAELAHRSAELAGLTDVRWRTGVESRSSRYDLDLAMPLEPRDGSPRPPLHAADPADTRRRFDGVFWTRDLAAWASIRAKLSPAIRATVGARLDAFTRGADLALQPRGSLDVRLARSTFAQLAAGAYRRPPEAGEELLFATLNPERATQVVARVAHEARAGLHVASALYFTDRRRLVMRDAEGALGNTGRGIDHGVELVVSWRTPRWFLYAGASLSKSVRHDFERAATRPSQFDQPVRIDAVARHTHGRWRLGARGQLASGLPDTPILGVVYDSDRDHYEPLYDAAYSSRLPFHHQLDLRVDRSFRLGTLPMAAFVDVSNVYASGRALGYLHSYDYRERVSIRAPIVPFVGVQGAL